MAMLSISNRVSERAEGEINQRVEDRSRQRIRILRSSPSHLARRLIDLGAEWDIERVIEASAAVLLLTGVIFGHFVHPYWLALPTLVALLLLQQAIQGWSPAVPILRWLGVRTAHEIERERQALKALRGDYAGVQSADGAFDATKS